MSALTGRLISTSWPTAGERDATRARTRQVATHQLLGGADEARIVGRRRGHERFRGPVGRTRVCHPASVRIASRNLCERSERGIRPIPAGRLPRRLQGCLLPRRIPARLLRAAGGLPSHLSARLQAGRVLPELLLWVHVPELPTVSYGVPTIGVPLGVGTIGVPTIDRWSDPTRVPTTGAADATHPPTSRSASGPSPSQHEGSDPARSHPKGRA